MTDAAPAKIAPAHRQGEPMTTPTPPAWLLCDHRYAGLPGCPTCDRRLDPEARRLLLELARYTSVTVMDAHATKVECSRLREMLDGLPAVAPKEPVGIGPWTRVGGPMPEPWPGMGIEWVTGAGRKQATASPWFNHDGSLRWLMRDGWDPSTELLHGAIEPAIVTACYDGRVCVWRAAP